MDLRLDAFLVQICLELGVVDVALDEQITSVPVDCAICAYLKSIQSVSHWRFSETARIKDRLGFLELDPSWPTWRMLDG